MQVQLKIRFLKIVTSILLVSILWFSSEMSTNAAPIELRLAHHAPPAAPIAKALEEWAKKIEKESGDKIKIIIYPSSKLIKAQEAFFGTVSGVCDIALINLIYERSKLSLNNIVTLLALPFPNDERGVRIWRKLWQKYPMMEKEFEGVKILAMSIDMYASIHIKKSAHVPKDLKGLKLGVMGGDKEEFLNIIGASSLGIPANDWYLSIEKGLLDGAYAPIAVLVDRSIEPITPYHIDLPMGQGGNVIAINKERWNSLSAGVKAIFEKNDLLLGELINKANKKNVEDSWEKCRKLGQTIYKPTREELKLWMEAAKPTANTWIAQNKSKGPSSEMVSFALKLITEELRKK